MAAQEKTFNENNRTITKPTLKPKYRIADLLSEMSEGVPLVENWEAMQPIGNEIVCHYE